MRWLDGITDSMDMEFQQSLGDSVEQGSLVCCSPWGRKELGTAERPNDSACHCSSGYCEKCGV